MSLTRKRRPHAEMVDSATPVLLLRAHVLDVAGWTEMQSVRSGMFSYRR